MLSKSLNYCLIAVSLFLGSCDPGSGDRVPIKPGNRDFLETLTQSLVEMGIQYEVEGDVIYVSEKDVEVALSLVASLSEEFLPKDRSVSYSPELQDIFKNKLADKGIEFKVKHINNEEWIVWSEDDDLTVKEIRGEVRKIFQEDPERYQKKIEE